jgi:hypothetical protein
MTPAQQAREPLLQRAWDFIMDIEAGRVTLTRLEPVQTLVRYRASNGFTITVFDDAGNWDYVERVEDADGNSLFDWDTDVHPYTWEEESSLATRISNYEASDAVARERYFWDT